MSTITARQKQVLQYLDEHQTCLSMLLYNDVEKTFTGLQSEEIGGLFLDKFVLCFWEREGGGMQVFFLQSMLRLVSTTACKLLTCSAL